MTDPAAEPAPGPVADPGHGDPGGTGIPPGLAVDAADPHPPYEQVKRAVLRGRADGTLPPGTRLPPVRRLADGLGLAANTVAKAYRELEAAGVIETRGRQGSFVRAEDRTEDLAVQAARRYADEARRLGLSAEQALAAVAAQLRRER